MSTDVLICPTCRARVFGDWTSCKFCGTALRVDQIAGTVHPDDLTRPSDPVGPRSPWENTWSGSSGGDSPEGGGSASDRDESGSGGGSDWSSWAGVGSGGPADPVGSSTPDLGVGQTVAQPGIADGTADRALPAGRESTGTGTELPDPPPATDEGSGALVHMEGAEATWVAGPAPAIDDDNALVPAGDEGPSGLEPVSWYSEPGSGASSGGDSGGHPVDDEGPSGLEPVSWYSEPGSGAATEPPAVDTAGSVDDTATDTGAEFAADRFDPDALFQEPEPGPEAADRGWDTSSAIETAVPDINWQASAGGWDRPVEPKGKPKGQSVLSREARLLLMGILVVLVVFVAGRMVFKKRDNYPRQWAANVEQVANWVSSTRNLPFAHPVSVKTLGGTDYDAAVRAAAVPKDDQQSFADQDAAWRALGAFRGDAKPSLGIVADQQTIDGAFYDLASHTLILRGGTDQAQLRVGVAGAMSIALDDQYGDLSSLRDPTMAEQPLLSVVMGNAERMRTAYLGTQSASLRTTFEKRRISAPGNVTGFFDAKHLLQGGLGGPFTQFVRDVDGAKTVNGFVKVPPISAQQIVEPIAFFNGQDPLSAEEPVTPDDADQLSEGTIGAQSWYLLVAGRLGPAKGLDFAERWAGDDYVAYRRKNGQVCVSDVLRGADQSAAQAIRLTLGDWAASIPGSRIKLTVPDENLVAFTACDPGVSADQGKVDGYGVGVRTIMVRSELAASYYRQGTKIPNGPNGPLFSPENAWCMADQVARSADSSTLTAVRQETGVTYQGLTLQAGKACDVDTVGQLFAQATN